MVRQGILGRGTGQKSSLLLRKGRLRKTVKGTKGKNSSGCRGDYDSSARWEEVAVRKSGRKGLETEKKPGALLGLQKGRKKGTRLRRGRPIEKG